MSLRQHESGINYLYGALLGVFTTFLLLIQTAFSFREFARYRRLNRM